MKIKVKYYDGGFIANTGQLDATINFTKGRIVGGKFKCKISKTETLWCYADTKKEAKGWIIDCCGFKPEETQ